MRRFVSAVLTAALLSTVALAEIPQVIGYQGRITENTGIPVANGTYSMQFRIYSAETGGTLLWDSGSLSVETNAGVFSVMLGESGQPLLNLAFDQDYWLLVTYRGEDQLPRKRLGSVGYAYMASGLVPGTEVSGSVTTSPFAAIKGANTATSGIAYGLYGTTDSPSGCAICGINSATTGSSSAIYGESNSPTGYAGFFEGKVYVAEDLTVDGTLSGGGVGDITAVTAGTGLDGGGTSGDVTLDVELPLTLTAAGAPSSGVIAGLNTATTGATYGVYGTTASTAGRGLCGEATATSGFAYGVYGSSAATTGRGVFGYATATAGQAYGVFGQTSSTTGRAIYGLAGATTGVNYGVYGRTQSPSGYAGYFQGDTRVTGDLTVDGTFSAPGAGDITAVTAGTGLDGGGTSGDVTLDVQTPLTLTGSASGGVIQGVNAMALTDASGVRGQATATSWEVHGVSGYSASTAGAGVFGYASSTSGTTSGVSGRSASTSGRGVFGYASTASGTNYGVYGKTNSASGYAGYFEGDTRVTGDLTVDGTLSGSGVGDITAVTAGTGLDGGGTAGDVTLDVEVPLSLTGSPGGGVIEGVSSSTTYEACGLRGQTSATSGYVHGVLGLCSSTQGTGVCAYATATSGHNYALYAANASPIGEAAYLDGDVTVTGALSKGSGSFLIDHPLDPENRLLRHNFVESPENLLIYRGTVQLDALGEAVVELPDYFRALTEEGGASVQLTPLRIPFFTAYEWLPDNTGFVVRGESEGEVSWMVLADRDDPVMRQLARPVEEEKGPDSKYCDRGRLMYPTAYGYPESRGRDYERRVSARRLGEEALQRLNGPTTE